MLHQTDSCLENAKANPQPQIIVIYILKVSNSQALLLEILLLLHLIVNRH